MKTAQTFLSERWILPLRASSVWLKDCLKLRLESQDISEGRLPLESDSVWLGGSTRSERSERSEQGGKAPLVLSFFNLCRWCGHATCRCK